eukprot:m.23937 g.23937  ORF g.23937 m.23937 type:complete len:288 (+) comp7337_c0_seq1:268-1131(+)
MAAAKKRCFWRGCNAWVFDGMLCRKHTQEHPDAAQSLNIDWAPYLAAPATMTGLLVAQPSENPVHLDLEPGTPVELVTMAADQRTAVIRTVGTNIVGYFDYYSLKTESMVVDEIQSEISQEQQRLQAQQAAQARQQEEYEEEMRRQQMKQMAKADVEARKREAELRLEQTAHLRDQLAEKDKKEAEARRIAEKERKKREADAALLRKTQERLAAGEAEAEQRSHHFHAHADAQRQYEQQLEAYEEQKAQLDAQEEAEFQAMLAKQPVWKRDLLIRKRQEERAQQGRA